MTTPQTTEQREEDYYIDGYEFKVTPVAIITITLSCTLVGCLTVFTFDLSHTISLALEVAHVFHMSFTCILMCFPVFSSFLMTPFTTNVAEHLVNTEKNIFIYIYIYIGNF